MAGEVFETFADWLGACSRALGPGDDDFRKFEWWVRITGSDQEWQTGVVLTSDDYLNAIVLREGWLVDFECQRATGSPWTIAVAQMKTDGVAKITASQPAENGSPLVVAVSLTDSNGLEWTARDGRGETALLEFVSRIQMLWGVRSSGPQRQ